jgi:exodeoxyribonuclease V alpha subunit
MAVLGGFSRKLMNANADAQNADAPTEPAGKPDKHESVTVEGHILDIRFQRDGFVIAKFAVNGNGSVSVLGNMVRPEPGMSYRLRGRWDAAHPVFGRQFRFDWYETVQPQSTDGIFKYLVRIAKWVGPAVGGRLVEKYGIDTLEIIKTNPERVAREISGITLDRAKEIQGLLRANELTEAAVVELEQVFSGVPGLRRGLAMDCVVIWEADAVEIVKKTPYRLMDLRGIGFLTADKIALHIGVDPAGIDRERACVAHVIEEVMRATGSTWIESGELATACRELIGRECADGLRELVAEGAVVVAGGMVSTRKAHEDETTVARKIVEIQRGSFEFVEDDENWTIRLVKARA